MNYAKRRETLSQLLPPHSAAIFINPDPAHKTADQDYPYRPDSNMIYLCGMDEPGAVAVIMSAEQKNRFALFVTPNDPDRERWVGPRYGIEGAKSKFNADVAVDVAKLQMALREMILPLENVFFDFSAQKILAPLLFDIVESLHHRGRRACEGPRNFCDIRDIIGDMRRIKDNDEIDAMKRAAHVSALGFIDVLKMLRPGVGEWQVEATLQHAFRMNHAIGESFGSICAGGSHAATLHYEDNRDVLNDGDLILIDAGAEVDYYAGDISRTFPVNGKFSQPQRDIYQLVLNAQKAGIDACIPGNHYLSPHEAVRRVLAQGLFDLGISKVNPQDMLKKDVVYANNAGSRLIDDPSPENVWYQWYFHGTGHYLGLDTHDVGTALLRKTNKPNTLQPGVVITVEPGLYFRADDENVPPQYRGIGVRIEDDVLVTEQGPVVLTAELIKEIDDIENFMAGCKP